jgi:hypothetical protein
MKINWKLTAGVVGLLLLASGGRTQEVEHAPTVEQCRADQALWLSKLESTPPRQGTADVDLKTLHLWFSEMNDCMAVDPANQFKYYNTEAEATGERSSREMSFIGRHGLYQQFLDEDEAGKR